MSERNRSAAMPGTRELEIVRVIDSPRDQVFKAWTEVEQLEHWWGPKGFTFREIVPPERLAFTFFWLDNPEREMLATVELAEIGDRTELTFHEGIFESVESRDSHQGGWNESFDRLEEHLEHRAESARYRERARQRLDRVDLGPSHSTHP